MRKFILMAGAALSLAVCTSAQTLQDAFKLTESEQYDAASAVYQQLLSGKPNDASLHYYFGDNMLSADNVDSARALLNKGKAIDANNALLKIGEAKLLLNAISVNEARAAAQKNPSDEELSRRLKDAQSFTERGLALVNEATTGTKDLDVLIEGAEALILYKNKDLTKAKELLDRANGLDQKNVQIHLLYGDLYAEQNNGTLAADYYNKAVDLNRTSARAIVSKGKLYKRSTNYEGAAQEFQNAIAIDPNYAPAHRELGEAYFKLGKLDKAKEEYRRYLELSKNNCKARIRYSSFLFLSKSYQEAVSELKQVEQRCDPNNITMLRVLTYCYYELKDTANGFKAVEKLFKLLPEDERAPQDYEYYGKLLVATNKDSLGIVMLKKAYAIDPTRADLLSEIASAYFKLKDYPNVIQFYNEKLAGGKDVRVTDYFYLGQAYYYNRMFNSADSTLMKLNDISPKFARGWFWRAKVNTQLDTTSELGLAKPFYETFIGLLDSAATLKSQPQLIEAYSYLAYYYILKKDDAKALEFLKKKMELPLDPEDKKNVQQAIDQLEKRKK